MDTEREWHVSEIPQGSETGYAIYNQHDPSGRDIAILYATPNAKEYAHLMAAAPDLFEALETLVCNIRYMDEKGMPTPGGLPAAIAAISKARGQ